MKLVKSTQQLVVDRISESVYVKQAVLSDHELVGQIADVGHLLAQSFREGGKILIFGNGGSASDSQHIAAELLGRFLRERCALPAIALTANTSCLTAIANDYAYDHIFARQIEALGSAGDVALAISTSGNSPNVLSGARTARNKLMRIVGMTGISGGELRSLVDYCLCVPSRETPRIQEVHGLMVHILCEIVEEELFDDGNFS